MGKYSMFFFIITIILIGSYLSLMLGLTLHMLVRKITAST